MKPEEPVKPRKKQLPDGFGCVLPEQRSRSALRTQLTICHTVTERHRAASAADRLSWLGGVRTCYFPTDQQLKFAVDFDVVLRAGYQFRNEALRAAIQIDLGAVAKKIERELSSSAVEDASGAESSAGTGPDIEPPSQSAAQIRRRPSILVDPIHRIDASGINMALLGIPQMGKSRTVSQVLGLYDQVVERENMSAQVVWLRLPCPADDDLPEFCKAFFIALDRALGWDCYSKLFAHEYASKANMAGHVLRLANIHSLGMLVVDDVHGGPPQPGKTKSIWHLLHSLSTNVGVPVLSVGTMAAADHLTSSAGLAFRSVGIGSDCWMRLRRGEQWQRFVENLWSQQWTNTPTPYSDELGETLYACCQGVIGLAVNLYHTIQHQLISINVHREADGEDQVPEVITAEMIEMVYEAAFGFCHEHVEALRSDDIARLRLYPDLRPLEAISPPKPVKPSPASSEAKSPEQDAAATGGNGASPGSAEPETEAKPKEHDVLRLARQILNESNVPRETGESWLTTITAEIEAQFDTEAREFMRRLELRIANWLRKQATWKFTSAQSKVVNDLRTLLDTRVPAAKVLEQHRIDGRALFSRR